MVSAESVCDVCRTGSSHHTRRMPMTQCLCLLLVFTGCWLKILQRWNLFTLTRLSSKCITADLALTVAAHAVNFSSFVSCYIRQ